MFPEKHIKLVNIITKKYINLVNRKYFYIFALKKSTNDSKRFHSGFRRKDKQR